MKESINNEIIHKLENDLALLKIQETDIVSNSAKALELCKVAFLKIKEYVHKNSFDCIEDEINFFRVTKPQVYSKLIFYFEMHRIEIHRPKANRKFQIRYFQNEFQILQNYLTQNYEFCLYYKSGQTCLDKTYFLRNKDAFIIGRNNYGYLIDPIFSTSHDELVAHIIAYEQLEKYIDNEMEKLYRKRKFWRKLKRQNRDIEIMWTAPKAALVELIYALHSSNCVNGGRLDVKELIQLFEKVFSVNLDKTYRIFIDIKGRQKEKAKFLEELKKAFLKRLNDLDALTK